MDWDWDDSWDETWDLEEKIIGTAVNDAEILEEDSTRQVELVKAIRMLHMRDQTHCRECEPLIVDSRLSREWCGCNLHSHFVAPWRCIPCVLAEEAHLVASQQKYTMVYDPTEIQRSWAYDKVSEFDIDRHVHRRANWRILGDVLQMWKTDGPRVYSDMQMVWPSRWLLHQS